MKLARIPTSSPAKAGAQYRADRNLARTFASACGRITLLGMGLGVTLALSACGSREGLRPADGKTLPVKPASARSQPDAQQLLTPSTQAQPIRVDELLRSSTDRPDDPFDLPPP